MNAPIKAEFFDADSELPHTTAPHPVFAAILAPYAPPVARTAGLYTRPAEIGYAARVEALLAPGGKFDRADPLNDEYTTADLREVAEIQAEEDIIDARWPNAAGQMIP